MVKYSHLYALLMFVSCTFCKGQNKIDLPIGNVKFETKEVFTSNAPAKSPAASDKIERAISGWLHLRVFSIRPFCFAQGTGKYHYAL